MSANDPESDADEAVGPDWNGAETPDPSESPRSTLLSVVVKSGSEGRPICTIYPPDVAAPYRTTTRITARSDAFVTLEEWR
ncbi:DUF7511 domain-containing protein [Halopiger xanaduensis]|uniref:DUF7511 domain-containing protein n=1 Tax=Halopiger xanaduensis (strain DSM 18323 / JCM 14033 / SH-6) TaxID=797210 RepID=F8D796_HALXS|nr:hypothetical protein [Halopiger xanaduensis]AEH36664.1 hypothetical protein Halxa_2039 [Halopiger xanaduensis SH-6]